MAEENDMREIEADLKRILKVKVTDKERSKVNAPASKSVSKLKSELQEASKEMRAKPGKKNKKKSKDTSGAQHGTGLATPSQEAPAPENKSKKMSKKQKKKADDKEDGGGTSDDSDADPPWEPPLNPNVLTTRYLDETLTTKVLHELERERVFPLKKKSLKFPKAKYFCRMCDYHCDNVPVCRQHYNEPRHRRKKEVAIEEKQLKNIAKPSPEHVAALGNTAEDIWLSHRLTDADLQYRNQIAADVQAVVNNTYPGARLRVYGSSLSGLGLQGSDLNLDLAPSPGDSPANALILVHSILKENSEYLKTTSDFSSKIPCIYFTSPCGNVECQITVNSDLSFYTNRLLAIYMRLDPRVQQLATVLRHWARVCQVDDQEAGSLSTYSFGIMTVYFLQQCKPPVLPAYDVAQALSEAVLKRPKTADDVTSLLDSLESKSWKTNNTQSLGQLWLDLLMFYGVRYDLTEHVICIREARLIHRSEKKWKTKRIAIEDPFSTKRNVARSLCNSRIFDYVFSCLRKSCLYFGQPTSSKSSNTPAKRGPKSGRKSTIQSEKTSNVADNEVCVVEVTIKSETQGSNIDAEKVPSNDSFPSGNIVNSDESANTQELQPSVDREAVLTGNSESTDDGGIKENSFFEDCKLDEMTCAFEDLKVEVNTDMPNARTVSVRTGSSEEQNLKSELAITDNISCTIENVFETNKSDAGDIDLVSVLEDSQSNKLQTSFSSGKCDTIKDSSVDVDQRLSDSTETNIASGQDAKGRISIAAKSCNNSEEIEVITSANNVHVDQIGDTLQGTSESTDSRDAVCTFTDSDMGIGESIDDQINIEAPDNLQPNDNDSDDKLTETASNEMDNTSEVKGDSDDKLTETASNEMDNTSEVKGDSDDKLTNMEEHNAPEVKNDSDGNLIEDVDMDNDNAAEGKDGNMFHGLETQSDSSTTGTESDGSGEADVSDMSPVAQRKRKAGQPATDFSYAFTVDMLTDGKGPSIFCSICETEGHLKMNCPEDQLPELTELPPITGIHLKLLTSAISQVPNDFQLSKSDFKIREQVRYDLERFIQELYPAAELSLFGSSRNGFGFHSSDLDLCVTFRDRNQEDLDFVEVIETICKKLKTHRGLYAVFPITTAKVPIVKFVHRNSQLEGDISLYNILGQQNTQLLKVYANIDPRVVTLGYAIKVFAKVCDIGDASKGSLSSYAYMLLLMHYLQHTSPPVIPVLQELGDEKSRRKVMIDGWDAWFYDDLAKMPRVWSGYGENRQTVGELWLGMFTYYLEKFSLTDNVISIKQFHPLTKFEKLWNGKCIAIEDPFDLTHNLGAGLTRKMNKYIMMTFIHARELYGTSIIRVPDSFRCIQDYFFDRDVLRDGEPPCDRLCRVCHKIGHIAKECPRVLVRKEREAVDKQRRGARDARQEPARQPASPDKHRANSHGSPARRSPGRSFSDPADGSPGKGRNQSYQRQHSEEQKYDNRGGRDGQFQARGGGSAGPSTPPSSAGYQQRDRRNQSHSPRGYNLMMVPGTPPQPSGPRNYNNNSQRWNQPGNQNIQHPNSPNQKYRAPLMYNANSVPRGPQAGANMGYPVRNQGPNYRGQIFYRNVPQQAAVEDEESAPKKEKKDPFGKFPKSTFDFDAFKREYSNYDTLERALPYFWEHLDKDNYSIWYCEYLYPSELKKVYMTCNLISGMMQRIDKMRKNAFASMCVLGADDNNTIEGIWVWKGDELAFQLSPYWQIDFESYKWTKLDISAADTKDMVKKFFAWEGDFRHHSKTAKTGQDPSGMRPPTDRF